MMASPSARRITSRSFGTDHCFCFPFHRSGITTGPHSASSLARCPGSTSPSSLLTLFLSGRGTRGPPSREISARLGVGTPTWSSMANTNRRSHNKDCIARELIDSGGGRVGIWVYARALGRGKSVEKNDIRTSTGGQCEMSVRCKRVLFGSESLRRVSLTLLENDNVSKDLDVDSALLNIDQPR